MNKIKLKKYKLICTSLNIISIILLFNLINSENNLRLISLKEEKISKEYINLVNFVRNNKGYINPKLIPNETSNINRYIITKEKIKKDEILLIIPDEILISKLHKSINYKCIEAYGLIEEYEYECVVYFMTIDKYNPSSIFKPYYDYLPKINISDFVFSFNEEEKNLFKDTGITEGIRTYEFFLDKALRPVEQRLKEFAKKYKIKYEEILEEFKYNFIMVGTRNFGRRDSIFDVNTMVPYLDLINHSDKNDADWNYDENEGVYILTAIRDIDKNEEITDSYGKFMNSRLYETYGFVIPGNTVNDNVYVRINGESITLNISFMKSKIESMFEKLVQMKGLEFNEAKKIIIKELKDKKRYYLNLKTNRFSLNVIIKEHLDIINTFIKEVQIFSI